MSAAGSLSAAGASAAGSSLAANCSLQMVQLQHAPRWRLEQFLLVPQSQLRAVGTSAAGSRMAAGSSLADDSGAVGWKACCRILSCHGRECSWSYDCCRLLTDAISSAAGSTVAAEISRAAGAYWSLLHAGGWNACRWILRCSWCECGWFRLSGWLLTCSWAECGWFRDCGWLLAR